MSNTTFTPKPGDVYRTTGRAIAHGIYRMYVKLDNCPTLLCVQLNSGEAYKHSETNGVVDPSCEEFVFNIGDIVDKE
jgi:hypothetical protein